MQAARAEGRAEAARLLETCDQKVASVYGLLASVQQAFAMEGGT